MPERTRVRVNALIAMPVQRKLFKHGVTLNRGRRRHSLTAHIQRVAMCLVVPCA